MQIEMEAEEKEHQYLFWLEATVNEFRKPVVEAAKERKLELGFPPNFPFPWNSFESFPTLASLAYQSFPWQLWMEILNLQEIIDHGCLF